MISEQFAVLNQKFIGILRRHLRYLGRAEELAPDTPLKELGLDSMDAVAVVMELEKEFCVTLPGSSLRAETFLSAATLWLEVDKSMRS